MRLVWIPREIDDLPAGLRYEIWDGVTIPPGQDEVEMVVLPYRFDRADGELLIKLPRLEVVQSQTAGVEHITPWIPEGVRLCNGRGIHDTSTSELAATLTLASLRGIPDYVRRQGEHAWKPDLRASLADREVLIVGYGQIGAAIEDRLRPFECSFVRVARHARDGVRPIGELPDLIGTADVVILVVPGTEETTGLMDDAMLARMKDGALLVNVSRGAVVDTDALRVELESGRLHAALDVVEPEPLPRDHPLWDAPNLLLVPHVGGNSTAMQPRADRVIREQLARYAAGEDLAYVVNGDY